MLDQPKRDTAAALRLMRKLLKKQGYAPDQIVTDKLESVREMSWSWRGGPAYREARLGAWLTMLG
jgi:transposase-like protein